MSAREVVVVVIVVWRSGSALVSIDEVNLRRVRLVLRWVTVSGFSSRCRTFISVRNQPPRPTQVSIPPGSVNGDQLRLGRKRQVWFIPLADERGVCR